MDLRADEFARRNGAAVEWREEPLRAVWHFSQLVSADSHTVEGSFECSVRVARHAADRQMLAETFLGASEAVTLEQIVQRVAPSLQAALCTLIKNQPASESIDPASRTAAMNALRKAGDSAAFACGIELLAPMSLHFHSPTLDRQQHRETTSARHRDDLHRATELLKQFHAMREAAPDLPAGQLLQRIAPADRGHALQSLLLAESAKTCSTTLWAVAGPAIVQLDPRTTPPAIQVHPLPTDLGPLRSVQLTSLDGINTLLIGAQRGIMLAALPLPAPNSGTDVSVRMLAGPNSTSEMGFNSVVLQQSALWGSHADIGLVKWPLNAESGTLHAEPGAGHLAALDASRLIYATSSAVVVRDGDSRTSLDLPDSSPVVGIIRLARQVAVITQCGDIHTFDPHSLRRIDTIHRGTPLRCAAVMAWQGDVRLLLGTEQGPVDCVGMDDPVVTQYASAHRGVKMLATSGDLIAAVSPDRQRIILWHTWDGQRPIGEIHVTPYTKHRIADIAFG